MAKAKASGARGNRRGSPEAVEKRKVARMFNTALVGGGTGAQKLDGRTEKRRQRLLRELSAGAARGEKQLKPLDVLTRVQELLNLGEPLASIRKACKTPKPIESNDGLIELVHRLHDAYGFRPETYRFVGIEEPVLIEAGVLAAEPAPKRRKKV